MDDWSERLVDTAEFKKIHKYILLILQGDKQDSIKESSYLLGGKYWWANVKKLSTFEWQVQFINHIMKFFESLVWEINNRKNKHIPSVEEYLTHWKYTTGAVPCLDLLEIMHGTYLPLRLRKNNKIKHLIDTANNIVF